MSPSFSPSPLLASIGQPSGIDTPWRWLALAINHFLSRFEKGDGCWVWTGSTDRDGYALIAAGGRKQRASRAALAIATGEIATSAQVVCHRCDNPPCVRPAHLFLGTVADNVHDMMAKGRNVSPPRRVGGTNAKTKLSESSVAAILRDALAGRSQQSIATEHGVGQTAISKIVRGRTWRHVPRREIDQTEDRR